MSSVSTVLDGASSPLRSHITKLLKSPIWVPALTLSNVLDFLFHGQSWWEFEPETIEESLLAAGLPKPSNDLLGEIQALASIRYGKSFVDKEWNLFEKCALALTGVPVKFYHKQEVPLENILHALSIMKGIGETELSEEVRHYIGCAAISEEILWHPVAAIDDCIAFSVSVLKDTLGIPKTEVDAIRIATKERFVSIVDKDISKIDFSDTEIEDQMCARILRSLLKGQELSRAETAALATWDAVRSGRPLFEGIAEDTQDSRATEDADTYPARDTEVEFTPTEVVPDTIEFENAVKTAFMKHFEGASYFYKDAHLSGVPVLTGIAMSGQEEEGDGPEKDREKTKPLPGPADSAMLTAVINNQKDKQEEDGKDTTDNDSSSVFNL